MTLHRNARTCPRSRRLIARRVLEQGWTLAAAAEAAGVSVPSARKWVCRYRAEGEAGLVDRSSAPRRVANRTAPGRVAAIRSLRALRFTAEEIAELLGMAPSTVSLILKREGLGRRPRPAAAEPERRYERSRAGELVHVDVKKVGCIDGVGHRISGRRAGHHRARGAGWDYVHVCVDDATRLAYAEVLQDERPQTAVSFLRRAVAYFASLGIRVERLMTDNGNPLPLQAARDRLPRARAQAPAHRGLQAAHQRQSRALHQNPHRELGRRPARLARPLQPQGPTPITRQNPTHGSTRPAQHQQRRWGPQLARPNGRLGRFRTRPGRLSTPAPDRQSAPTAP